MAPWTVASSFNFGGRIMKWSAWVLALLLALSIPTGGANAAAPSAMLDCAGSTTGSIDDALAGLTVNSGRSCASVNRQGPANLERFKHVDCGPRALHPNPRATGVCAAVRYACVLGAQLMTAQQRAGETTVATLD